MLYIADCHLGKMFKSGVPSLRKGDRDELQFKQFEKELSETKDDVVILGDLFDKPNVEFTTIVRTRQLIEEWSSKNPDREMVLVRGNHEASRSGKPTCFDILALTLGSIENVFFVTGASLLRKRVLYVSWDYSNSLEEQIGWVDASSYDTICCHAEDTDVPFLNSTNKNVRSGHLHNYPSAGRVIFIKSMLPLNHLEAKNHPRGDLYVTYEAEEFENANPSDYKDKCVRLVSSEFVNFEDVDCLQFQVVKPEDLLDSSQDEVEIEEFDMREVFLECMKDVDEDLKNEIWEQIKDMR